MDLTFTKGTRLAVNNAGISSIVMTRTIVQHSISLHVTKGQRFKVPTKVREQISFRLKMATKDSIVVLLLLQSLGLFGSVTYCV